MQDEYKSLNVLDTKNKTIQMDKYDKSGKKDSIIFITNEIKTNSSKNIKYQSKLPKETDKVISNESNITVELKKKKKKEKTFFDEDTDDIEISRNKKSKTRINNFIDNKESQNSRDSTKTPKEQYVELTYKFQNLVNLLINNSSAGKKYCKDSPSPLFEKKIKELADSVKNMDPTKLVSTEIRHIDEESMSNRSTTLDLNYKKCFGDFEEQKTEVFDRISKRHEMFKYRNEKSIFIAKHGDVLFFGSNINDIKGYGEW